MGIIGKVEKLVNTAYTINNIANMVNSSNLLKGVNINDLKSFSERDLTNIGGKLTQNITSMSDDIKNAVNGSTINQKDIEGIVNDVNFTDLKDLGMDVNFDEFKDMPGFNESGIREAFEGISFR